MRAYVLDEISKENIAKIVQFFEGKCITIHHGAGFLDQIA